MKKSFVYRTISSRRRLLLTALVTAAAFSPAFGAGSYSLRGLSVIGDTTYVAIQDTSNGRTRLLEVGDNQNRAVYVQSWDPNSREAVIVASGQRMTLQMEQPDVEGLPAQAVHPMLQERTERTPRKLPSVSKSIPLGNKQFQSSGAAVIGGSRSSQAAANAKGLGNAPVVNVPNDANKQASRSTGGSVVVGGSSGRAPTATATASGASNVKLDVSNIDRNVLRAGLPEREVNTNPSNNSSPVVGTPASRAKPRTMLPLNSSGLTKEEKEANAQNGTTGQRAPE